MAREWRVAEAPPAEPARYHGQRRGALQGHGGRVARVPLAAAGIQSRRWPSRWAGGGPGSGPGRHGHWHGSCSKLQLHWQCRRGCELAGPVSRSRSTYPGSPRAASSTASSISSDSALSALGSSEAH